MISRLLSGMESGPALPLWFLLFIALGFTSPTIINYSPYGLAWDQAYHLHRAVCMNHAVYDLSYSQVTDCLARTHKDPITGLIALPWGRVGSTYWGVRLAFVALGIFVWILALATYATASRAAMSGWPLLLGAATICFTPFLRLTAGDMMTDTLLGWTVALGLMLIPLEYNRPQTRFWPSVLRGLLWGFVIDVGMLSKVTFGFFLVTIGSVLLVIRWHRSGMRPLLYSLGGCMAGAAPAILIWLMYGWNFLSFAILVARDLAALWGVPGMTAADYWARYFSELGWALIPLLLLLAFFVRGLLIEKPGRLVRLLPIGIVLGYLFTAAMSQNRDPRFTVPVMIAMPFCLAWTSPKTAPETTVRLAPILAALLVGTLSSLPMAGRPDLTPIQRSGELLRSLSQGRPTSVLLATDGTFFNVETIELARQIEGENLRAVRLDTLVYDEVNKRTLEDGLRRIDNADYVLFLKPGNSFGPDWTMTRAGDYRTYCEKVGTLMTAETSPDFDVFKIR
jgi:hypothetical protein